MISVTGVSKRFGQRLAVDNISLQAKAGEIIGFLGANGAGKTTTMRLILGYLQPTSGTIVVDTKSPANDRVNILKKIGYLPENNPLYSEMKVAEYLNFIAQAKKTNIYSEVAASVGLEDVLNTKIEELSRGYKQRVGLAAALLGEPEILILDEPTSGLDPIEQERIKKLILKIAKKKTIIFSTHILSEIEDIATRLIIIDKGNIVYEGAKPKSKGGVEKLFKKIVSK